MKTDDLIDWLASDAGPAPRAVVARRLGLALGLALAISVASAGLFVGYVPAETWHAPALWFKLLYCGALGLASLWLVARLARPGAAARLPGTLAVLVILAAFAVGALAWQNDPPAVRRAALLGASWARCPLHVLALSLPALTAAFLGLRGLAPTRLRAAGFAAGLLAGAVGAAGYALACTELGLSFVSAWYTLGILLTGGLGALLGPRLLRW